MTLDVIGHLVWVYLNINLGAGAETVLKLAVIKEKIVKVLIVI